MCTTQARVLLSWEEVRVAPRGRVTSAKSVFDTMMPGRKRVLAKPLSVSRSTLVIRILMKLRPPASSSMHTKSLESRYVLQAAHDPWRTFQQPSRRKQLRSDRSDMKVRMYQPVIEQFSVP